MYGGRARCGDLDGGSDNGCVWLQCSCGGLIMQPEQEPPNPAAKAVGGDKVRMTFRVILGRQQAEALATRAIPEERNEELPKGEPG
jgi:hypothetical protein